MIKKSKQKKFSHDFNNNGINSNLVYKSFNEKIPKDRDTKSDFYKLQNSFKFNPSNIKNIKSSLNSNLFKKDSKTKIKYGNVNINNDISPFKKIEKRSMLPNLPSAPNNSLLPPMF